MVGSCVDDRLTPIVKLPQAHKYAQLLWNFAVEHPLEFSVIDVMNMQSSTGKLSKMSIFNINKHHQKTIDFYFCSGWYSEDIIGLYFFLNSIVCDNVSIFLQ